MGSVETPKCCTFTPSILDPKILAPPKCLLYYLSTASTHIYLIWIEPGGYFTLPTVGGFGRVRDPRLPHTGLRSPRLFGGLLVFLLPDRMIIGRVDLEAGVDKTGSMDSIQIPPEALNYMAENKFF